MRSGITLIELAVILVIFGIVSATAIPRFAALRDRLAVHGATSALTTALADARHLAVREARYVALTATPPGDYSSSGPASTHWTDIRCVSCSESHCRPRGTRSRTTRRGWDTALPTRASSSRAAPPPRRSPCRASDDFDGDLRRGKQPGRGKREEGSGPERRLSPVCLSVWPSGRLSVCPPVRPSA